MCAQIKSGVENSGRTAVESRYDTQRKKAHRRKWGIGGAHVNEEVCFNDENG